MAPPAAAGQKEAAAAFRAAPLAVAAPAEAAAAFRAVRQAVAAQAAAGVVSPGLAASRFRRPC